MGVQDVLKCHPLGKYPLFSERLKAIHPPIKVLRRSFPVDRLADKNLLVFGIFKIRYRAKLAAFGYL